MPPCSSAEVASRLQQLRSALADCMDKNAAASELERVEQADFLIDRQLKAHLLQDADTQVGVLAESWKHIRSVHSILTDVPAQAE